MRYAIEIRKDAPGTVADPSRAKKPYTRGIWVHAETVEADCTADARRMARRRYVGQKWRINYNNSAPSTDDADEPAAPPAAAPEAPVAEAPKAAKAGPKKPGPKPKAKAVKK